CRRSVLGKLVEHETRTSPTLLIATLSPEIDTAIVVGVERCLPIERKLVIRIEHTITVAIAVDDAGDAQGGHLLFASEVPRWLSVRVEGRPPADIKTRKTFRIASEFRAFEVGKRDPDRGGVAS